MSSCPTAPISISQAKQYAQNAGFSGNALDIAVAIAQAESGLCPLAIGPVGEIGIMQIYPAAHPTYTKKCLQDPQCNFKAAHDIYVGWGNSFKAWTTFNTGAYQQFMNATKNTSTPCGNAGWGSKNNNCPDTKGGGCNVSAPWLTPIQCIKNGWTQLQIDTAKSNIFRICGAPKDDPSNCDCIYGAGTSQAKTCRGAVAKGQDIAIDTAPITDPITAAIKGLLQPFFDALPGWGIHIALFFTGLMLIIIGLWILTRNPASEVQSSVSTGLNRGATAVVTRIGSAFRDKPKKVAASGKPLKELPK